VVQCKADRFYAKQLTFTYYAFFGSQAFFLYLLLLQGTRQHSFPSFYTRFFSRWNLQMQLIIIQLEQASDITLRVVQCKADRLYADWLVMESFLKNCHPK